MIGNAARLCRGMLTGESLHFIFRITRGRYYAVSFSRGFRRHRGAHPKITREITKQKNIITSPNRISRVIRRGESCWGELAPVLMESLMRFQGGDFLSCRTSSSVSAEEEEEEVGGKPWALPRPEGDNLKPNIVLSIVLCPHKQDKLSAQYKHEWWWMFYNTITSYQMIPSVK